MCLFVGFVGASPPPLKICVSVCWVTMWVRPPPSMKICVSVCGGVYCGCVPPLCVSFHWKTIFVGSLHAAYSALRHFLCFASKYNFFQNFAILKSRSFWSKFLQMTSKFKYHQMLYSNLGSKLTPVAATESKPPWGIGLYMDLDIWLCKW